MPTKKRRQYVNLVEPMLTLFASAWLAFAEKNTYMAMIYHVFEVIEHVVWGPFTLVALICVGLYFQLRSRFLRIGFSMLFWEKTKEVAGNITPFSAMIVSLAGTVGIGNIAGVALAIIS